MPDWKAGKAADAGSTQVSDPGLTKPGLPRGLDDFIEVERARIESSNRRTEITRYAIELSDAADRRQFEYRMARLQSQNVASAQRFRLAGAIAVIGLLFITLSGLQLLYMAFYGSMGQSQTALAILKVLGLGVAGYGVGGAAVRGVGGLLDRWSKGD